MQEPVPSDPDGAAALSPAEALLRAGDAGDLDDLRQAVQRTPGDADAHYRLGRALADRSLGGEAVPVLQQAVRVQPDHVQALVLLGRILIDLGNPAAGKAALKAALRRSPQTYAKLFNLGNLMRHAGCHVEALAAFDAAIRAGPESASAHHNRGICLRALGREEDAVAAYRRAVELDPGHKKAHHNLGNCLRRLGRYSEAERALRRTIELDPDWFSPHYLLGRVLNSRERHGEAVVALRKAIRLQPDHVDCHVRLGVILQEIGHLQAARASYLRALELSPDNASALALLAQIDPEPATRQELDRWEARLATGEPAETDRRNLHFALAQRYDQVREYSLAFDHLVAGNRIKRAAIEYDLAKDLERFRRIAEIFDSDFFVRHGASGEPSALPIFVVGMPRSGTTLIEQILASHSRVHGAGEISALADVARQPLKAAVSRRAEVAEKAVAPDALQRIAEDYLRQVRKLAPHALRVVDKFLSNFMYVGMIKLALPNAQVIHARRHPLDTCLSVFRKLFAGGLGFSYDLAELGAYYAGYARLMRHWHEVLPGFVLDVQYEELIDDQRGVTERILAHCGLEWDESCMHFHQTQRLVRTSSVAQVRQPIYRSSAGAWKRYGERLRPLIEALGDEIDPSAFSGSGEGRS